MHYRFALFAPLTLHKSNIKKYSLFVSSISFRKIKMNYKTILLCPTSNKWQTRRYQIYEKHFSTDPYNFLFVYVFKFFSLLAFCRWMSFILYKGYHCVQGNDKKVSCPIFKSFFRGHHAYGRTIKIETLRWNASRSFLLLCLSQ